MGLYQGYSSVAQLLPGKSKVLSSMSGTKNKGTNKQIKLRESVANSLGLQEIVKEIFQAENKQPNVNSNW